MATIFTDVTGSLWPRYYFISFFIIVDLVVINLAIAILLEIYSKVEEKTRQEFKTAYLVDQVRKRYAKKSQAELERDILIVREEILRKEMEI